MANKLKAIQSLANINEFENSTANLFYSYIQKENEVNNLIHSDVSKNIGVNTFSYSNIQKENEVNKISCSDIHSNVGVINIKEALISNKVGVNNLNINIIEKGLFPVMKNASKQSIKRTAQVLKSIYQHGKPGYKEIKKLTGLSEDGTAKLIMAMKKRGLIYRSETHFYHFTPLAYDILAAAVEE